MGGLEEMKKRNEEKAKILYDFLDSSKLFHGTVVPKDRSLMKDVYKRQLGDPIEVTVRGYELSLRKADAEMIEVE